MSARVRWSGVPAVAAALVLVGALAAARPAAAPGAAASLRDPALATGILPNGMRYFVRANPAPAQRVTFRLAVNAGSVLEDADQQGFAHFLEHMLFDGTRHFPYNPHHPAGPETAHNSIIDFFETNGMRFGGDLNAETSADETVYQFTLPSDDPATVQRGLDLLQDWASGGALIDSSAVLGERGVVMGEYRLRELVDTSVDKYRAHLDSVWLGHSRYLTRQPIGDTTLLQHAEPGPIRRFYRDWYRPDLMAVVVVGDVDRDAMVREIERRFGHIPAPARERPRTQPPIAAAAQPAVDTYRGPFTPTAEVVWRRPPEPPGVEARFRQRLVEQLLQEHWSERLLAIQERPARPFIVASLEQGALVRPLDLVGFQLIALPESLTTAVATALAEVERVAQHGVPAQPLAHEKAVVLQSLVAAAGGSLARPSDAFADAYVDYFLTGRGTLLSPQQELDLGRKLLPDIGPADLAAAARTLWAARTGEHVNFQIPEFWPTASPTQSQVLGLLDSVQHADLAPLPDSAEAESPLLAQAPTPGRITAESLDAAAGITKWTLSNGARVILKPTANDPDEVRIRAWGPGGFSRMPDTMFDGPGRMVAKFMTAAGGLGTQGRDALERRLSTTGVTTYKLNIGYADQTFDLGGSPRALTTLFQLLYLQFNAPKVDTTALRSWASLAKYQYHGLNIEDLLTQIFARGVPKLLPVETNLAELLTPAEALAAFKDRFGDAANFTFFLVGAITPEEARPLVERYIASLPSTGKRETVLPLDVRPWEPTLQTTLTPLTVPKAVTAFMFDGTFPTAPADYLATRERLGTLVTVLGDRMRDLLRMHLSATYSPIVFASTYSLPEAGQPSEHYRVTGFFDTAPRRMWGTWREFGQTLDSLRTQDASAAEMDRAATILRRQHETALESNSYWLDQLQLFNRLGIPFDRIITPYGAVPLTPDDLKAAAQHCLPSDFYVHLTLMPSDTTLWVPADTHTVSRPAPQ